MSSKKQKKEVYALRIRQDLLDQAREIYDLPKLIETYLEWQLNRPICPCCRQKIKKVV